MNNMNPKVSIIMTTFNEQNHIKLSIQSILSQTYKNYELIIVDDASTDKTCNIIKKLSKEDNRIILIENKENVGFCKSLNIAIEKSKGEYIARADGDDVCLPFRLEKEVQFLDRNPDITVVGSSYFVFDDNGIWGYVDATEDYTIESALKRVPTYHPTVMMRRKELFSIGCYTIWTKKIRCSEDFDLWLKFLTAGYKIQNLKIPTIKYREDQFSFQKRDKEQQYFLAKLKKEWRRKLNKNPFDFSQIKDIIIGYLPRKVYSALHKKSLMQSLNLNKGKLKELEGIL